MNNPLWSRRSFLGVAGLAAAAAALPTTAMVRRLPGFARWRPSWIGFEDLLALQGERVHLVGDRGTRIPARVIDVADRTTRHRGVTVVQYSVLLRTGRREPAPDQIFRIEHPEWGSCELFCSPVFSTTRGLQYEATLGRFDA